MRLPVIGLGIALSLAVSACAGQTPATGGVEATAAPASHRSLQPEDEVFYHVFMRSMRDSNGDTHGDLQGIIDSLDYMQGLGVTSVLLTPLYPSRFYHNYFADDFEGIDPEFGTMDDFAKLVSAVHARGMKIYIDQEIHYVAGGHKWLTEALNKPKSPYSDYVLYNGPGNTKPESGFFGLTQLPVWTGGSIDHYTVNLHNPRVQSYFADYFLSWVDPNQDGDFSDGVDGFRIDHMMDDLDNKGKLKNLFAGFWQPLFAKLRSVNPQLKLIAEQADWSYGEDFLTRGATDYVFAFPLRAAILSFDKAKLVEAIRETAARTPPGKHQLVFIENHDMNRFASEVGGNPAKLRAGAALSLLLKGTPLIYYGQELGMQGRQQKAWGSDANDIPVREGFKWNARVEGPGTPVWYKGSYPWWNSRISKDGDGISVEEQKGRSGSLLSFYQRLLELRRAREELRIGDQQLIETPGPALQVLRKSGTSQSLLLVNTSGEATTVAVSRDLVGASSGAVDLISGKRFSTKGSAIDMTLPGYGVILLAGS